jgi:hypothetical protein
MLALVRHCTQTEIGRKAGELAAREWRCLHGAQHRAVINDLCEFEIGLKRTIGPRGKPFSSEGHTTMPHPLSHANRAQIARQLQCNFCNFELRS